MSNEFKLKEIALHVCNYYGITSIDLYGKCKKKPIDIARQMYYYISRKKENIPNTEIGRHINRGHSTVSIGFKNFSAYFEVSKKCQNQYQEIIKNMQNCMIVSDVNLLEMCRHEKTNN